MWGEKVAIGEGGNKIVRGASAHFDVNIEKTAERHLKHGKGPCYGKWAHAYAERKKIDTRLKGP